MSTPRPHKTASSPRRDAILDLLRSAPKPQTVHELAQALKLKPSTARADIEVLRATGAITRVPLPRPGRGRPRWGYSITQPAADPYEALARVLARQLGDSETGRRPEEIAEEWLSRVPRHEPAHTPDEAVAQAASSLESLGFNVAVNPLGTEITMTGCPYAALVPDFPMICDIHGALVRNVLVDSGQPVDIDEIDVWAKPGVCVARLTRPDLHPERTIRASELASLTPSEPSS
jgi:predicted ArsR family transcriptional regulator